MLKIAMLGTGKIAETQLSRYPLCRSGTLVFLSGLWRGDRGQQSYQS